MPDTNTFITALSQSINNNTFVKLSLGKPRQKQADLKKVMVKIVQIKGQDQLSFTYRATRNDTVKNHPFEAGIQVIQQLLNDTFFNANLFTTTHDSQLMIAKNGSSRVIKSKATFTELPTRQHNRTKNRPINTKANYLHQLGIISKEGKVRSDKQAKFRQINKYIEIIADLLKNQTLSSPFKVADMGAGKGYLTFALYDYLTSKLGIEAHITGVEIRQDLVDKCNRIAQSCGFKNLQFVQGSIDTYQTPSMDMLIALHACDTATDQAIFQGIQGKASYIICAPCCHKQIRKQLKKDPADLTFILKHGILQERQAEMITDGLRALLMESQAYQTKIFEFISNEHTSKNLMIVGKKVELNPSKVSTVQQEIQRIKKQFKIQDHALESLLMEAL